ncbi:hypothetical protein HPB52_018833 [Rhipicephalus sanguineus]|uniref:Uncharacterized protein n=1 Tax=Rhipicephalus sanguineus TaxID=34632 RepID=A0A9D4PG55_RHISA|nr:hypothetical protein HPB52_018833 [Rhipicephalus sanguineus]
MGLPKGVEISMYAFITSVELSRATQFFKEGDVGLGWNPVTHAAGFIMPMVAFVSGAMVVPAEGGLSPKEFVEIVNKHKVFQLDSLRNGYGLSETIGSLTITTPNAIDYRSVGHPVPMVEYKNVMSGYYKQPDATAQVIDEEGWFRSGDAGYYDHSGQLHVVERLKDMIKCLDQQVAPAEIETLLTQHPLVSEAAVVGIDHPDLGEAPTAFVVVESTAKGRVSEEELVQLVAGPKEM